MSELNLSPIDRGSDLRTDAAKLEQLWKKAQIIQLVDARLSATNDALTFIDAPAVSELLGIFIEGERFFLGTSRDDDQPYFAWRTTWINQPIDDGSGDFEKDKYQGFKTLREVGGNLDAEDLTLAMHAVGLANWHENHTHCSKCGAQTVSDLGGSVRVCVEDSTQHHPRTDPAVIVLVRDAEDRILLGHQPIWPEKRFSTFAGFVETGESFEECVSREVFEEAGVYPSQVKYITSQPWPFPASIMIAFEAFAERPQDARPDGQEITAVRWLSRDEMKQTVASGEILLPPGISVARRMIESWYTRVDGYSRNDLQGEQSWRP
ncbi:MAG: NAD(+) diphosphatase [Actinobacteria bacterium]|uniref:NAD(+) diphosphatase n=1 Tax=freshwater metagenome TaxID=449393 RepID=A0A6J6DVJ0_9ZZZZ|nr:NAD(+) diphosphatase [Actinomycetota bacterium]